MKKRVFIVHGWDGNPQANWFPWLKKELKNKGFEVFVPQLPDPENPRIKPWVSILKKIVGTPNAKTYFVGHSMGCQAIARYLEALSKEVKVGGAIFIAGFFKRLTGVESEPGSKETVKHWLEAPLDFKKIRPHLLKSIAIFSDNDPYVPLDNQDDYKDKLGSKIIVEHNMSHFNEAAGVTKIPVVLKSILKISKG